MKAKQTSVGVRMKIRLDYDVPNPDDSIELFEKGLREAMNKTAKRFGLEFEKLTVEVEDEKP